MTRGERQEARQATHRIYAYREIVQMLEEAGFRDCKGFGSLEAEPFSLGSARLIIVASKSL